MYELMILNTLRINLHCDAYLQVKNSANGNIIVQLIALKYFKLKTLLQLKPLKLLKPENLLQLIAINKVQIKCKKNVMGEIFILLDYVIHVL